MRKKKAVVFIIAATCMMILFPNVRLLASPAAAQAQLEQSRSSLQTALGYLKNKKLKPAKRSMRVATDHFALALYEVRDNPAIKLPANVCALAATAMYLGSQNIVIAQKADPTERAKPLGLARRSIKGALAELEPCGELFN